MQQQQEKLFDMLIDYYYCLVTKINIFIFYNVPIWFGKRSWWRCIRLRSSNPNLIFHQYFFTYKNRMIDWELHFYYISFHDPDDDDHYWSAILNASGTNDINCISSIHILFDCLYWHCTVCVVLLHWSFIGIVR